MLYSKKEKIIIGVIVAILVVLIISGIYATVTQRFTVVRDTQNHGKWRISFDNLREANLVGNALELTKPTINTNDTKISEYSVSVSAPGDSITYVFDVVNSGDYDALISSIIVPKPVCHYQEYGILKKDNKMCQNISYTLKYEDGNAVSLGDSLLKKQRKTMVLQLKYNENTKAEDLPTHIISLSNLDISIIYSQCGKKCQVTG